MGTSVVNAFIIFNELRDKKIEMINFREEIVNRLLASAAAPQQLLATASRQHLRKKSQKHELMQRPGPAKTSRKRCLPCYTKMSNERESKEARKSSKRVVTYCNGCEEKPTMCLQCFNEKHT